MRFVKHAFIIVLVTFYVLASVKGDSTSTSSTSSSSGSSSGSSSSSSSLESVSQSVSRPFDVSMNNPDPNSNALSTAEKKRIRNRDYMRERRKQFPEFNREQRRNYQKAHENDPEWRANKKAIDQAYRERYKERKKLRDKAYRERNHDAILQRQRKARELKKQRSQRGASEVTLVTKKRKTQELINQSGQKRARVRVDPDQQSKSTESPVAQRQPNSPKTTHASQTLSERDPSSPIDHPRLSQGRNVLRIKLSQKTIDKYLSHQKPRSPSH
ncbi:uncharacterized protein FA14DRAFT_177839 [Meira miltonrushii]|uniref:BZIP domain-containing protein n=1 Tax=Meira miltonrushii TaxID=1280837 RepID=A0A316VLY1_9BASI|nr:uncharacterized protein FA14DRAFT_177839 [Meira miltonrushii]PWN38576.1 hypothetical protein FA14DRAFT_177839 [Meira miltonrushii]